jgi:RNA polymerase sigma-70 factor (ECF subfamily)
MCADELAVDTAAANQRHGAPSLAPEVRGASLVAEAFKGRARHASAATIDGSPGAVWAPGGHVRVAFVFTIEDGTIVRLEIVMEPARLAQLSVVVDDV